MKKILLWVFFTTLLLSLTSCGTWNLWPPHYKGPYTHHYYRKPPPPPPDHRPMPPAHHHRHR